MAKTRLGISMVWVLLAVVSLPGVAWGQNCALCYTQAAGAGARMIAALRSGILALIIPPMLICVGITWMAYKKRNQFNDDDTAEQLDIPHDLS